MKTVEIRVRPVVRHVVTRYTSRPALPDGQKYADGPSAKLETLGEFDNETQAEQMAEALRGALPKPMQYVAVERCWGSAANVVYFDSESAAIGFMSAALDQGREFRIYGREVTDPIARARIEMGVPDLTPVIPPRIEHATGATNEEKLADIPNLLRTIAAQLDAGQLQADTGVVTLRAKGKNRPAVFGFGAKVEPHKELQLASNELEKLGH